MYQLGIQLMRILTIFVLANFVPFQAKKSSNRKYIVDIDDIKPFKKLQRTHTNLLVLFSKNDKSASTYFELLGNIAKEIKGKGTIAFVNCGDSKKLCKKLKVSPKPTLLKHFKDGKFNKDYDRKYTFKSMMKFLNNPTGDAPWEEEPGSEDVTHLETAQQLNKLLGKEKKPILIMFYAPWCGFCKRFKPEYSIAATEIKDEVVLAGMDVDTQEGYSIRMKYNITGFPTVLYFVNGQEKFKYSGKYEKDALLEWLKNPSAPPPQEETEEQWSDVPSEVVHLTDGSFDEFMEKNPSVLVMFYAPWCGHCKQMKPGYTEAAKTLKDEGITGILAAVDATKERNLGKKFKVEGYPTVKYFRDGKFEFDVNERKADAILSFMKDPKEPPPPPPPEPEWSDVAPNVLHLTDETFKNIIKKKKHVLVMFYAPWCGHCKKAKPEVVIAAEHHNSNSKVAFAGVDCTKHSGICEQYGVSGYPTFRYFNYGKKDFKYTGGRTSKDFIQFMDDPKEGPPPPPPEPEWTSEPSNVLHLTENDFEDVIKEHESVLVMFYAPWCGHCKAMKPNYVKAAEEIFTKKINGILAAVDCTKHRKTAKKFDIAGFPTLKHFRNGKLAAEYSRGRTTEDLVDFMRSAGEEKTAEAETVKPASKKEPKEGSWAAENNDVIHLDDATFDDFIKTQPSALVMFYAPWCPHCQRIKPAFGEVAKETNTENKIEGVLIAVDCTEASTVCSNNDVKSYPTLKYFKNGQFQFKYSGGRNAKSFREFIKDPKKPPAKPPSTDWSTDSKDAKVVFLSDKNFDGFVSNHSDVLVLFYAPWCGHCNAMKKSYFEAAKVLDEENPSVKLVAVDATKNRKAASKVSISGYPTVKLFKKGKEYKDYEGDRSKIDIIRFMRTNAVEDVQDVQVHTPNLITRLTKPTFQQFLKDHEHVLVMFFAPWCGHCKQAKPEYEKAAKVFKSQTNKIFATVDCTVDSDLCNSEDVNGYPTLKHYYYSEFVVEYDGDRVAEDFILFMQEPPLPYRESKESKPEIEQEKPELIQEKPELEHENPDPGQVKPDDSDKKEIKEDMVEEEKESAHTENHKDEL